MKNLSHYRLNTEKAEIMIYNNLLDQIELVDVSEDERSLLNGRAENGNILVRPDIPENIGVQMNEAQLLGTDAAVQASLYGSDKAKRFTPDNFTGFLNLEKQLLSPSFWMTTVADPKRVPIQQIKESMQGVGNPTNILSGSPLLSDKTLQTLLGNSLDQSIKMIDNNGSGDPTKISLTSLEYLKGLFEYRHQRVSALLEEQSSDFLQKMQGEVWWKKKLRSVIGEEKRIRFLLKYMQRNNDVALKEINGIIKGIEQRKEQDIFTVKTTLRESQIRGENSGDTEILEDRRKTITNILNHPEEFLENPDSFEGTVPLVELFGRGFSTLDVLDTLKHSDYLGPTIGVNHWQMSHHNAIKTIDGIGRRVDALNRFEGTNLTQLESHILKFYETTPSADENREDLQNPKNILINLKKALESARPGLNTDLNDIISGDLYMNDLEQFWIIAEYFSNNIDIFDQLPPELKKDFGSFLLAKREELEKPLIAGNREEGGTIIWRVRAMNLALNTLNEVDRVKNSLSQLGEKLHSREPIVAQQALQDLKSMTDSYDFFLAKLGVSQGVNTSSDEVVNGLLSEFPDFEQGLLRSVFEVGEFIETIRKSYIKLDEDRNQYEKLLLVDDEDILNVKERLIQLEEIYDRVINEGLSGLEGVRGMDIPGMEGGLMGGDLETIQTTLQRDMSALRTQLRGENDSEDGGLIGRQKRRDNFTFRLPGDIGESLSDVTETTERLLEERLRELGVRDEDVLEDRPTFDVLARLDLGDCATKDIEATATGLLQNETVQQFQKMKENKYFSLQKLFYAKTNFQGTLTPHNITNPKILEKALYIREDDDGAIWYHTETQVIKIIEPKLGSATDQRNIAIWNKQEKGYGFFNISITQPDELGILLSANPENSAAQDNPLYQQTQRNIVEVESVLPH